MTRQRALVVFPGRGVYGKDELGYFHRHHGARLDWLATLDAYRHQHGRRLLSDLDRAETYLARDHASSENASALIYACALADFAAIDRDRYDIVAITGNSLGWYLALAGAGALRGGDALHLVDTMGQTMAEQGRGGQLVTSIATPEWHLDPARVAVVERALEAARAEGGQAQWSIRLGGTAVLGGDEKGLSVLEAQLPQEPPFPFRLARHAAFHTSLLSHVPALAQAQLPQDMFDQPQTALIDGRGVIWRQTLTDLDALYAYTLGHQIEKPYDFTRAVAVGVREFAPEVIILTGPGTNLGGAIAQSVIAENIWPWTDKASFIAHQKTAAPRLLAMGMDDQRARVAVA